MFNDNVASMSSEKLFDEISKLEISKYYVIFDFDFCNLQKLRQPRAMFIMSDGSTPSNGGKWELTYWTQCISFHLPPLDGVDPSDMIDIGQKGRDSCLKMNKYYIIFRDFVK